MGNDLFVSRLRKGSRIRGPQTFSAPHRERLDRVHELQRRRGNLARFLLLFFEEVDQVRVDLDSEELKPARSVGGAFRRWLRDGSKMWCLHGFSLGR